MTSNMEWQPIETAPKVAAAHDEPSTKVLLCEMGHPDDYQGNITVGFWAAIDAQGEDPREGWCDWCRGLTDEDYWIEVEPTHWMPLPPPPKEGE